MRKPTVLVVDRNPTRARGMAQFLRRRGMTTAVADDVERARDEVRQRLVHLVVAASEFGPAHLLAAARERAPEAECLVIAGGWAMTDAAAALRQGAYDVVDDPLDLGRLGVAVDRALERGQMRAELERLRRALESRAP